MTENASDELGAASRMAVELAERASGSFLDELETRLSLLEDRVAYIEAWMKDRELGDAL